MLQGYVGVLLDHHKNLVGGLNLGLVNASTTIATYLTDWQVGLGERMVGC